MTLLSMVLGVATASAFFLLILSYTQHSMTVGTSCDQEARPSFSSSERLDLWTGPESLLGVGHGVCSLLSNWI